MRKLFIDLGNNIMLYYGRDGLLLEVVSGSHKSYTLNLPIFEIDGKSCDGTNFHFIGLGEEKILGNGGREIEVLYKYEQSLLLSVQIRTFPESPLIKYRYILSSDDPAIMTKSNGHDSICYTKFNLKHGFTECIELQFAQFNHIVHSYAPSIEIVNLELLGEGINAIGPVILATNDTDCVLMAYEHGAEYPDGYLEFNIKEEAGLMVELVAKKGNYYAGQCITDADPFRSCWFEFAVCEGNKDVMFRYYREFILQYISVNNTSRNPYIYYNTWNNQERNRNFNNQEYLSAMKEDQILKEIDTAHRLGVDVFVLDTGWYHKTGDWEVDCNRFPRGLAPIYEKLKANGMKLGLWMNPIAAAKSSKAYIEHPEFAVEEKDGSRNLGRIWETEESYEVCLVSDYYKYLIDTMIKMNQDYGVTYFKWDAVGQYGCQSIKHHHGGDNNSVQERMECYSYQMGLNMIRVVEEVALACPEVIVDFDITEEKRFVGLGFLSVGKYFHVNNGPYAKDYELPEQIKLFGNDKEVYMEPFMNIFSFPGIMRSKICRQNMNYDFFAPSILFLAHYFPDGSLEARNNAMTSMVLGGNGIWGDLLGLSELEIKEMSNFISTYKQVAKAVTACHTKKTGFIGSNLEIYEKIDVNKGNGLIAIFTRWAGNYTYLTRPIDPGIEVSVSGAEWEHMVDGRLRIQVSMTDNDAKCVFIIAK